VSALSNLFRFLPSNPFANNTLKGSARFLLRRFLSWNFLQEASSILPIAMGVALMAAASQILIPFIIPVTAQTVAALVLALYLRPGQVWLAMLSWLTLGTVGAPVFAGFSGGVGVLLSPTAGFLVGMTLGAPLASKVFSALSPKITPSSPMPSRWRIMGAIAGAGAVLAEVCLGLGWAWLSVFYGPMGAFCTGVKPFVIVEIAKIILVLTLTLRRKAG
jgi:biotin transport system substrate-specific component